MAIGKATPVLVESRRGAVTESKHRGCIAVVDPTGECCAQVGDISVITLMRSTAKPIQALPLIVKGVDTHFHFSDRELSIIVSSHSGEDMHIQHVRAILDKIGLDKEYLHCGAHVPMDWGAEVDVVGKSVDVLRNTCSGKHAGMLARCVLLGADVATYESLDHPVQQEVRKTLADFVGVPPESMPAGTESCTAPVFGLSIERIAFAYARLVNPRGLAADVGNACRKIISSMLDNPELVGGSRGRSCTDIMRVCDGRVVAKDGAEGVYALAILPSAQYTEGLGIAIKIEDGSDRAASPVVVEILSQLGVLDITQKSKLSDWWHKPTRNFRGGIVGELLPTFELS